MSNHAINATSFDWEQVGVDWSQLDIWLREELFGLVSFVEQRGWHLLHIAQNQSKILHGVLAIWAIELSVANRVKKVWIISGDLPTDFIPFSYAENARDASLAFSRKYLKRAQQARQFEQDKKHKKSNSLSPDMIEQWVKAAANLLVLHHEEAVWQSN